MGFSVRFSMIVAAALGLAFALPASAQFSDSYSFLQGVKDRDGAKVMPFLDKPGSPVLNTRDGSTGDTALHIVVKRHDTDWLTFLLYRGANTEIKDRSGNTPLMIAAQTGDVASVNTLISYGANPNTINSSGETPLIFAVHLRNVEMVHALIAAGADPSIRDNIAGKSATDYAAEDKRGTAMVRALADAKPKAATNKKIAGPVIR
jgi:ankyrin repeat protein